MIVHAEDGVARLSEPRDLGALSLVTTGSPTTAVGAWGRWVDEGHVVVASTHLLELAGDLAADPDWRAGFDAMIAYATTRGWVDDAGGVRIHVATG